MKICYIIALHAEAQPLIDHYRMKKVEEAFPPLPCELYQNPDKPNLSVVLTGSDHERDLIGCEAACVTTMAAIQQLKPDLIISSGTCGGLKRYGGETGKVYISSGVIFHDRRIPDDNAWGTQSLGNYPIWEGAKGLYEELKSKGLNIGYEKVSTGSSFTLTKEDEAVIEEHDGRLIDMEGAAVAFVCSLYKVPVMLVKVISNLCDEDDGDIAAFFDNLHMASENLLKVNAKIVYSLECRVERQW